MTRIWAVDPLSGPRCGYEMKIISLINHTTFDRADFDPPSVIRSSDYWSTNTDAYQPFTM